jgi:hypothetical protein
MSELKRSDVLQEMTQMENQNTQTERVPNNTLELKDLGMEAPDTIVTPIIPTDAPEPAAPDSAATEQEFVFVDGERVDIDPNEVIGEKPDGSPMYLRETDNPKSYKYFQVKDSKKLNKIKELEEKLSTFEQKLQSAPPPQEAKAIPNKPVHPGQKPEGYNKYDAFNDPESPSYKWQEKWDSYLEQKSTYDEYVISQYESTLKATEQEKHIATQRAQIIGEIQKHEPDPIKAQQILDWFYNEIIGKDNFREVVNFHNYSTKQLRPQAQQKMEQMDKNGKRQDEILLPPGVVPKQPAPSEYNFGDELVNLVKQTRI